MTRKIVASAATTSVTISEMTLRSCVNAITASVAASLIAAASRVPKKFIRTRPLATRNWLQT